SIEATQPCFHDSGKRRRSAFISSSLILPASRRLKMRCRDSCCRHNIASSSGDNEDKSGCSNALAGSNGQARSGCPCGKLAAWTPIFSEVAHGSSSALRTSGYSCMDYSSLGPNFRNRRQQRKRRRTSSFSLFSPVQSCSSASSCSFLRWGQDGTVINQDAFCLR